VNGPGRLEPNAGGSRIAPRQNPPEPVAALLGRMMPPGRQPLVLFQILAHNEGLLDALRRFGTYLLRFGTIEPADRELIISRTTALCRADYEWAVHAFYFGRQVGLDGDVLRATRRLDGTAGQGLTERQRLLILLCDELHADADVSDDLWARIERIWPVPELLELVVVATFYRIISALVNTLRLEHEPYARDLLETLTGPEATT
jgi:alkylhydroperoxidase family enzyme